MDKGQWIRNLEMYLSVLENKKKKKKTISVATEKSHKKNKALCKKANNQMIIKYF